MTRKQAIKKLFILSRDADKNGRIGLVNFYYVADLIDEIYEDIGTCKKCKYADKIEDSTLLDCTYFENVTPNFYCGNFEKNQE